MNLEKAQLWNRWSEFREIVLMQTFLYVWKCGVKITAIIVLCKKSANEFRAFHHFSTKCMYNEISGETNFHSNFIEFLKCLFSQNENYCNFLNGCANIWVKFRCDIAKFRECLLKVAVSICLLPYLPVYKSTFYGLKRSSKNRPRLIHGSKISSQVPAK